MTPLEEDLLHLGQKILHSYIENADIEPLLAHLAPDIIWMGAGREMLAQGRDAVTEIFRKGKDQLVPCAISEEETLVHQLCENLWLVQLCSLEETLPTYKMYLQGYQRCAFCFRKNLEGQWEIAYLNHSMAYEALKDTELFAIGKGIRNFRRLKTADLALFTNRDKAVLYQFIDQFYLPLPEEEKRVCLGLSLFPQFSKGHAEYLCAHAPALRHLEEQWERNPFLVYEPAEGAYTIHPVFREYLQGKFHIETWNWQKKAYIRAARWQRHQKKLPEALQLALEGRAFPLALRLIHEGGLTLLNGLQPSSLIQLLHESTPLEKVRRFSSCTLLLLALNLLASPQSAREERDIFLSQLPADWEPTDEDTAQILFLQALDSVPDLDAMLPALRRVHHWCLEKGVHLSRDYFQGIHRGITGPLSLYYRNQGQLEKNVDQLKEIYAICGQCIEGCSGPLWQATADAEKAYLQGNLEIAEELLLSFFEVPFQTLDQQQHALLALYLYPRIVLLKNEPVKFRRWKAYFHRLQEKVTDPLTRTDLELSSIFISGMLEQPGAHMSKALERLNNLPEYPSLQSFRQSVRHRIQLALRKYNLLLLTTQHRDTLPQRESSQLCRCYNAITRSAALEHTGQADKAEELLATALDEAIPDNLTLPFVEHTTLLKPIMDRLAPRTKYNTFIKHLKSYTLVPVTDPTVEENKLNPRDLLIIQRVKEVRTNKEIAEELNVAEITVKKQLSSLYQRYKVHNRNQLLLALDQ